MLLCWNFYIDVTIGDCFHNELAKTASCRLSKMSNLFIPLANIIQKSKLHKFVFIKTCLDYKELRILKILGRVKDNTYLSDHKDFFLTKNLKTNFFEI